MPISSLLEELVLANHILASEEVEVICARLRDGLPGEGYARAWEYWKKRALEKQALQALISAS